MFVQSNSIQAIKEYFKSRLTDLFSDSEIKQITQHAVQTRMNWSRAEFMLSDHQLLSESDLLYFRSIVKRLLQHEPAQYVFGDTEFCGLIIKCDSRALIPRPETEELVDWIITDYSNKSANPVNILDLCTGTGCIALALKNEFQIANVSAVDYSKAALTLAQENSENLNLAVYLSELDVLSTYESWNFEKASFDIWVSNPPYIPEQEKETMQSNVLEFEPAMALFVSDDSPLVFYDQIIHAGLFYLKVGGSLYFELHENYAIETKELMEIAGYLHCEIKKDMQGKSRMLKGIRN